MPKARIYPDFDYELETYPYYTITEATIEVSFAGELYLYRCYDTGASLAKGFSSRQTWYLVEKISNGTASDISLSSDISLNSDVSLGSGIIDFITKDIINGKDKNLYIRYNNTDTLFSGATWSNLEILVRGYSYGASQFKYYRNKAEDLSAKVAKRLDKKEEDKSVYYAWSAVLTDGLDNNNPLIYTKQDKYHPENIYLATKTDVIELNVSDNKEDFKPFMYCQTNDTTELKDPFEDFEEWHCGEALYSLPYDKFGDEKLNEDNYNIENKIGKYQKYLSGSAADKFAVKVVADKTTYIIGCKQGAARYKINDDLVSGYKVGYVPLAGEGHQNCGLLAAGHGESVSLTGRNNIIYNSFAYNYLLEIHISNDSAPVIYAKAISGAENNSGAVEYTIGSVSDRIATGNGLFPSNCRRLGLVFTGGGGAAGTAVEYHYKCGSDGVDYSIPGGGGGGAATIWGVLTPGKYILLPAKPTNAQGQTGKPSYLLSFSSQKSSGKYRTANLTDYYNDLKLCATANGGVGGDKAQKTGTTNGGAGGAPDIGRGSKCNGFYCCDSKAGTKGTSFSFNSEDDGSFSCTAAASLNLDITFLDDSSTTKQFTTTKENHPTEKSHFGNSQIQEIHKGDVDEPVESNKVFCSGGNSYGTGATWNADNSYGGAWYGGGGGCRAAAADPSGTITNAGKDQGGAGYWEIWY